MPKRGDNIHKRKDGRWEGRYKTGNDKNGKTIYSSVYGKSYTEVKQKLNEIAFSKKMPTNRKLVCITFAELLNQWSESTHLNHKSSTENKYRYMIKTHIIPELGNINISDISAETINNFLDNKLTNGRLDGKGGLKSSYVRSMIIIINSALKYASKKNYCKAIEGIFRPSNKKTDIQILSTASQSLFEKYLLNNISPTVLGILISLYTGLRIGEVCALMWSDIDFEQNIIHIRSTVTRVLNKQNTGTMLIIDAPKTDSSIRDIPIPSLLLPYLIKIRNLKLSEYVISEKESFVSPRTYEYRYHKHLKKAGLESINYHALRHTFATRCIEVGVDIKTLSEILGHSNVSITLNTYVHSSMELKKSQIEKLVSISA